MRGKRAMRARSSAPVPPSRFSHGHGWLKGLVALRVLSIILLSLTNSSPVNTILESSLATIHLGAWMAFIGRLLVHWIFFQFPNTSILWESRLEIVLSTIASAAYSCICNARRCILRFLYRREREQEFTPPQLVFNLGDTTRKGISESLETIRAYVRTFKTWAHEHISFSTVLRMRTSSYDDWSRDNLESPGRLLVELSRLERDRFDPNQQNPDAEPLDRRTTARSLLMAPSRVIVDRGDQNMDHYEYELVVEGRDKNL